MNIIPPSATKCHLHCTSVFKKTFGFFSLHLVIPEPTVRTVVTLSQRSEENADISNSISSNDVLASL